MAITPAQKNIVIELARLAKIIIAYKSRAQTVVQMYANENVAGLADADIEAVPGLEGVTAAELQSAKAAHDTIVTAIGEFVPLTPATKLLKVIDSAQNNIIIMPQG